MLVALDGRESFTLGAAGLSSAAPKVKDVSFAIQGKYRGLDGGVPNSVFNKKCVLIRDSISEISP